VTCSNRAILRTRSRSLNFAMPGFYHRAGFRPPRPYRERFCTLPRTLAASLFSAAASCSPRCLTYGGCLRLSWRFDKHSPFHTKHCTHQLCRRSDLHQRSRPSVHNALCQFVGALQTSFNPGSYSRASSVAILPGLLAFPPHVYSPWRRKLTCHFLPLRSMNLLPRPPRRVIPL
jgi:hypothetical protein